MRPLNATLLSPVWPVRVRVASVTVRVQRGRRRRRRLSGRQVRPTRRPRALTWIAIFTVAGWSRRNEKTVPFLWRLAAVRPVSGVDPGPTANTLLVSLNPAMAARVGGEMLTVGRLVSTVNELRGVVPTPRPL